ncbi:MAG: ATPase domain-containing protein [Pseudomonadota bacterium]
MTDKLDLSLLATGVPGLDTILGGGLPELSFNIIGGPPGSGKTTVAQQIMFSLAKPSAKALFFTALGEPAVKMLRYQQQFSFFNFDKVGGAVKFISLANEALDGNYDTVLNQIKKEVETHKPAYVFIDSFRSFIQGAKGAQQEVYVLQLFIQQLVVHMTSWQATTFLIGEYEMSETDKNPIFTVADGILWLSQNVHRNSMVRKIQVLKMRGQEQRPGLHTLRISRAGIEIFPRAVGGPELLGQGRAACATERVSVGVPMLDEMLGGGLPTGYSMLLVGPSGSGKTMLAIEFLAAAVRQQETAVLALFERTPHQVMSDKLDAMVRSGEVALLNMRALDLSIDETLQALVRMVDQLGATRVVLDSLSGFELSLAPEFREDFRESLYRMITVLNDKGVTLLMTTELEDRYGELRFSPYGSAFLVDAIVMQRFIETEGQLKTVISVVKVRGSAHSRDLRQFDIGAQGIVIGDAPVPYAGVLTGSPRSST